jgi:hypothetical protein
MKGCPLFSFYAQRASPRLVKGDQAHAWAPRARYTAEGRLPDLRGESLQNRNRSLDIQWFAHVALAYWRQHYDSGLGT